MKKIWILMTVFIFCSNGEFLNFHNISKLTWQTFGKNFHRNSYLETEINPPLELKWTKELSSAAADGFVLADNFLVVPVRNKKIHFINADNGNIFETKKVNSGLIGSPTIYEDKVIIPGSKGKRNIYVYSLEKRDFILQKKYDDIETSPAVYKDNILFGTLSGDFYSIKMSGKKNWRFKIPKGIYSSPALYEGKVIFSSLSGEIYCLNAQTGELIWEKKINSSIFSTPMVINNRVFIGSLNGDVLSLSLDNGEIFWMNNIDGEITGIPVSNGNIVAFCTDKGEVNVFSWDGNLMWKCKVQSVIKIPPVITKNYLYTADLYGFLYAVNLKKGTIEWQYNLKGRVKTSLVIDKKNLYVAAEDKKLFCFRGN